MTSLGLDYNNSIQLPLTLDGLNTVSTNSLNLDVGAGILQCDSLGDVFGSTNISSTANFLYEPSIQGVTMTNFIRNAITGSTFIDLNKNTGIISLSGGVASKWTFDTTANVIYNNVGNVVSMNRVNVTGNATFNDNLTVQNNLNIKNGTLVASNGISVYNLGVFFGGLYVASSSALVGGINVTGSSSFNGSLALNSGLNVSGNMTVINDASGLASTIRGIDGITANYELRGAFRALENTPTQSTTGGLELPRVVASFQRSGRAGVVNSANIDFRLSSYEKNTTQSRTQCDIHLHNGFSADAPTPVMTLRSNGNVGIGTTGPNSTLTVSGNMGLSGAMTISGTLNVSGNMNVTGNVTFNNGISVSGTINTSGNMSITGSVSFNTGISVSGTLNVSGNMNVTGSVSFNNGISVSGNATFNMGLLVTGGSLNVIGITSLGDITLARNNNAIGKKLTFTFGTGNANLDQGIVFQDATTVGCAIYGGQDTIRMIAGNQERMSVSNVVNFATAPYVAGSQIDTNDVIEGTNLYYTDARARLSISGSRPLVFDNSTGIMSLSTNMTNVFNNRIAIPNEFSANSFSVGFGSWNNNDTSSWADCIALNTWNDSTGGLQNFVAFRKDTVPSMRIYQGTFNDSVAFSTYRDAVMANQSGNVGIGTNSPTARLHLTTGNVGNPVLLRYNNTVSEIYSGCDNTSGPWFGTSTNHNLRFTTNALARMTIDTAGNVGIGTITPTHRLTIDGGLSTPTYLGGVQMLAATQNRFYSVGQGAINNFFSGWVYNSTTANAYGLIETYGGNNPLILQSASNGKVGIGTTTPTFKLDVEEEVDTTIHCRSTATTGYCELYLQNDNSLAGGGLVMYGSLFSGDANKRNALELGNEIGGIFISSSGNMVVNTDAGTQINMRSNLALSGNVNIGRGDNTFFDSALVVAGGDYRTLANIAGIHMGYSANGFGASLGLIGSNTGNCQIEFGARNDLGVADGYIRWNNSSDTMALGADVITFNTNPTIPHTERARFLADGTFVIGDSSARGAFSTLINNVEQVLGRVALKGYSSSDQNPVIMFQEWNGGLAGGREHYFFVDGSAGFRMATSTGAVPRLGINISPAFQLQLSTDSAGKPTTNAWTIVSDRRLKENIQDANLDICYENMKRLKLKHFNYREDWMYDADGNRKSQDTHFLGFISQEVQEVFPKAVTVIDDSENSGIEDLHTLDTDQLMKSAYGALQKLIQKVENLEETIIKERIQYKTMKQKQDALLTKQGVLIDCMKKALLMRGITI